MQDDIYKSMFGGGTQIVGDPYSYFNEKNAILLNCKNPK
jgi:hypothetical protein